MLNFIICDDNGNFRKKLEDFIFSYMMKNKLEYKTHVFSDYDNKFLKIIEEPLPFKIYILDIETPTKSGIDIARIIRKKDIDSVLIFLTGHQELGQVVLKNDFLFLSYINKFDNCQKRLNLAIDKAIKVFKLKPNIRFKDNGTIYTIPQDDILYITRDSVDRKSLIITDYNTFRVGKSLSEIESMLNSNFVKTHRACLINKKRVQSFNKSMREVVFDNGTSTDLISSRFNGELV